MHPRTLVAPLTLFGLVLLAVYVGPRREPGAHVGRSQIDCTSMLPRLHVPDHPLDRMAYPAQPTHPEPWCGYNDQSQRRYDGAAAEGARDAQHALERGRLALDTDGTRGVRLWMKTHHGLELDSMDTPYGHGSNLENTLGYAFGYDSVMAVAIDARYGRGVTRRAITEGERLYLDLFFYTHRNADDWEKDWENDRLEDERLKALLPVEVTSFAIEFRLHADRAGVVDSVELFASYEGDGGCKRGRGSEREKENCPPSQPLSGPYPRFEEAYVQEMKRRRFGAVDAAYSLRDVNPRVVVITTWSW